MTLHVEGSISLQGQLPVKVFTRKMPTAACGWLPLGKFNRALPAGLPEQLAKQVE